MNTEHIKMLESTAKAVGIFEEIEWFGKTGCFVHGNVVWNPLEDDAQCLQLARALGISLDFSDCCAWVRLNDTSATLYQEYWGGDCWRNDREATVAVAAALGENL